MSAKQTEHAQRVVNRFRELLSNSAQRSVTDKHFQELTLMVDSAISTAVMEELERVADDLNAFVRNIRHSAETFD